LGATLPNPCGFVLPVTQNAANCQPEFAVCTGQSFFFALNAVSFIKNAMKFNNEVG